MLRHGITILLWMPVVTAKAQLHESMALLNKHKTNDFRASMLMKWSRQGGSIAYNDVSTDNCNLTPRSKARKRTELKELQAEHSA